MRCNDLVGVGDLCFSVMRTNPDDLLPHRAEVSQHFGSIVVGYDWCKNELYVTAIRMHNTEEAGIVMPLMTRLTEEIRDMLYPKKELDDSRAGFLKHCKNVLGDDWKDIGDGTIHGMTAFSANDYDLPRSLLARAGKLYKAGEWPGDRIERVSVSSARLGLTHDELMTGFRAVRYPPTPGHGCRV